MVATFFSFLDTASDGVSYRSGWGFGSEDDKCHIRAKSGGILP